MTEGTKCEVRYDAAGNIMRMWYRGHVAAAEMKAFEEEVRGLLPQVRRGFTLLTDLSGLDSMELDCMSSLTKAMDEFKANGIGAVVRIVPDPAKDIGFNILSVVHYRRGVRVVTCQTAEEAARAI